MAPPSFVFVVDYDDIATQLDNAITRISQDPNREGPLLFLPPSLSPLPPNPDARMPQFLLPCLTTKATFGPKIKRRQRIIEKMDLSWLSMGLLLGSI